MWVRVRAPAPAIHPSPRTNGIHRPERSSPAISATRPNAVRKQQRSAIQVTPVQATKRWRGCVPEAEEDNVPSSGSSCAESGEDAQSLYRSAILGVRNANHARQQARTATVNCPVCAKLAAVLEHFL